MVCHNPHDLSKLSVTTRRPVESTYVTFLTAFNHRAQLIAIRSLLEHQERADQELSDRIKKAYEVAGRTRGRANEHSVAVWVELLEMASYQKASHSMVAVGMIAPFIESFFRAYFGLTGKKLPDKSLVENIVKRIAEDGMEECMPRDLEPTLSALFEYRNNMFHGGFEWSSERLKSFEGKLRKGRWPIDWFSWATWSSSDTTDPEPWMCHMTPIFISHCLDTAEGVIEGIEEYETRERPDLRPSDPINSIYGRPIT